MDLLKEIRARAKSYRAHIILPESSDARVIRASQYIAEHNLCEITLLGSRRKIADLAKANAIPLSDKVNILRLDDLNNPEKLAGTIFEQQKEKGITYEEARALLEDPLYFAGALVATGRADGCVAGSVATTAEVIKTALGTIGLSDNSSIVSSIFLMDFDDNKVYSYADCGVVPYPDSEQLSEIALETARTHALLTRLEPVIAMLSFSTMGSARHERVELVKKATALVKQKNPDLLIDCELQFDTAAIPEVARKKVPDSEVGGRANIFIFPNLDAGNIAYKITERLAGATATGPILQGLKSPMMDLSRGCDWNDIVNAVCVAILMRQGERTESSAEDDHPSFGVSGTDS